jgi:hypothetical protein
MKASDWISIAERKLPKINETVLICQTFANGSRIVRQATFVNINGSETFIDENGVDCYFISHWQKLVLPNEQKLEDVSERENHIEHMLSDDWEGDEEIFLTEDECSKPFNTPKILGCVENLNDIIK